MSDGIHRAALAERAARAGGVVARKQFRGSLQVEQKANKTDLVSDADRAAQRQVIATIRQEFPGEALVCEEESLPPGVADAVELQERVPETGPAWVVDPIDGTNNYVRGIRFWATSVTAVSDGEPVATATYLPAEDDIYASGPESTTRNDDPIAVSDRTDPQSCTIGLIGHWPASRTDSTTALVRNSVATFGDTRRFGCMQGVLALVAAGSLDAAFMPTTPHPWDALGGVRLIRQAGGRVTDVHGDRFTNGAAGLVVSNGHVHETALDVVAEHVDS
jgi:myo-inositol-1(or 4)-monophosphatase